MLCGATIVAGNDSLEHLIPASLGGRAGVSGFICRDCNSRTGEGWDKALFEQLRPFTFLLDVKRQRGKGLDALVTSTAGEQFLVAPGGGLRRFKPEVEQVDLPDGRRTYRISARSMAEARGILEDLKRKRHPEIDVEASLASVQATESYPEGAVMLSFGFGGPEGGRSVVKSCLALAHKLGIDWRSCASALRYLRDGDAEPCFGYFTERDLVTGRVAGMPLHCLAVRASPDDGLILAYAEYFGTYRVVSCLGEGYAGPPVQGCYALDPRDGTEQPVSVELAFTRADMAAIYAYERVSFEAVKENMAAVVGPVVQARLKAEGDRVTEAAVEHAFATCGAQPGEMLTEQHLWRMSRSIAEAVTPSMLYRRRPIGGPPWTPAVRARKQRG